MIFRRTSKEPGMWRGWLHNDQSVELVWGKKGWQFGLGIHVHMDDDDRASRMLMLYFWRGVAVIPLGYMRGSFGWDEEPQWSVSVSKEFGAVAHLGFRRWSADLPCTVYTVEYQEQLTDGRWRSVWKDDGEVYSEIHPYTYVLRSGEVQNRTAKITKRRHILNRRWLNRLWWPNNIRESIDVQFSGEVGERSGSWKGGCIGCSYDLRPGEAMEAALRRMERERKF
jgi:hypothetical protein